MKKISVRLDDDTYNVLKAKCGNKSVNSYINDLIKDNNIDYINKLYKIIEKQNNLLLNIFKLEKYLFSNHGFAMNFDPNDDICLQEIWRYYFDD